MKNPMPERFFMFSGAVPSVQELRADLLRHKAAEAKAKSDLAAIEVQQAQDNATLDPESQAEALLLGSKAKTAVIDALLAARIATESNSTPSPRRRCFKSITQVNLPNKDGDLYYALIAICEEGRAWRKYQGQRWIEIESLPDI